jgi:hypothetical protein
MSLPIDNQIKLYKKIGLLFKGQKSGEDLVSGFMTAADEYARAIGSETHCEFLLLSWGSGPLGTLGVREFANMYVTADVPEGDESDRIANLTVPRGTDHEEVRDKISEYDIQARTANLASLSRMHRERVNAPLWVLGYPDKSAKSREQQVHIAGPESDSLYQLMEQYYPHVTDLGARYGLLRQILIQRYFGLSNQDPDLWPYDKDNIYYIPKYSDVRENDARFACQAVFGFRDLTLSTFRYMQKAGNLFMDLLLTHLANIVNLQSSARGLATSVENKGFAHNLNYVVHAPNIETSEIRFPREVYITGKNLEELRLSYESLARAYDASISALSTQSEVLKYLAARQTYIAQRGWGARPHMVILPLSELFSVVRSDAPVFTTLLSLAIKADVALEPETPGVLAFLPGGRSAVNAIRNILENLVRNIAKHSSTGIRSRLQQPASGTLYVRLTCRPTPDLLVIEISIDGYDHSSFSSIAEKMSNVFLVDDSDEISPNSENRGMLEVILSCMALRGLPVELLRGRKSLAYKKTKAGLKVLVPDNFGGRRTALKQNKLLEIEVASDTTLVHRFCIRRAVPILCLVDDDEQVVSHNEEIARLHDVRDSAPDFKGESFVVLDSARQVSRTSLEALAEHVPIPRISSSEALAGKSTSIEALADLWLQRITKHLHWVNGCESLHTIIVVGGPTSLGERIVCRGNVRIVFVLDWEAAGSLKFDNRALAESATCCAILTHGMGIPSTSRETVKQFGVYRGPTIEGWKDGNPIRSVIFDVANSSITGHEKGSDVVALCEFVEAARAQVLIVDERFEKLFGSKPASRRDTCEGLPPQLTFPQGWALQGVHLSMNLDLLQDMDWHSFDFVLVHDGWWRSSLSGNAPESLSATALQWRRAHVVVHSDGSTFKAARDKGDLFTLSWSGLYDVLDRGSKVELLRLIQRAQRLSRREALKAQFRGSAVEEAYWTD